MILIFLKTQKLCKRSVAGLEMCVRSYINRRVVLCSFVVAIVIYIVNSTRFEVFSCLVVVYGEYSHMTHTCM
jgi:hypothetical protein